jgi:RimJ/RimL family protein N-acetyltransferase
MINAITLKSDRLILKAISKEHISNKYVQWMNDSDVTRYLETGGDYTLEKLASFISDVEKKNILFWAIHIVATGNHIGNIKIDPLNIKRLTGEYGIMMGDKSEWGKGYAKEASTLVINYCFNNLNLRKITLGVISENQSAINLYKRLGFEIEGVYKKFGFYNMKYCDCLRMAIFNKDKFLNAM